MPRTKRGKGAARGAYNSAELVAKPSASTPMFYANHMVVGSSPHDTTMLFGWLSPFEGVNGLAFPSDKPGQFEPVMGLTIGNNVMASLAQVLLVRFAILGGSVDEIAETAKREFKEKYLPAIKATRGKTP